MDEVSSLNVPNSSRPLQPWAAARLGAVAVSMLSVVSIEVHAQTTSPSELLQLEAKIPLGAVRGRIDHLAIDLRRRRLFVAELGNGSVGVVDLSEGKAIKTIRGFNEPQGIGYLPSADTVYVASGGDGLVTAFTGDDLSAGERVQLGDDADNVRVEPEENNVVVGYGGGALAIIDAKSYAKVADIALKAHPESFQINRSHNRIFVNVPDAHEVAVVDPSAGKQIGSLKLPGSGANFSMALDESAGTLVIAVRNPGKLFILRQENGGIVAALDICNDADDVSLDGKRQRIYVSCGEGAIEVVEFSDGKYRSIRRLPTVSGARTSLFIPELDRLYLAVRAAGSEPAAIWAFRPFP